MRKLKCPKCEYEIQHGDAVYIDIETEHVWCSCPGCGQILGEMIEKDDNNDYGQS